jgi:methionyl-tRNA synthetase
MNLSLQICANLAVLCAPFLPFTADKLHAMLNLQALGWKDAGRADLLMEGHQIGQPELLFEQISDETIQAQVDKLQATKAQNELNAWQPAAVKENVTIDDFGKMDIRVGTILECQKVPKADKLLQFKIEDGMGTRTIVSGIAKYYPEPEKLVGKQVCFIANFPPRKLKGVESQGMILSAEDKDGRLVLVTPSQKVTEGCSIG